jgi:hypothetical protein
VHFPEGTFPNGRRVGPALQPTTTQG